MCTRWSSSVCLCGSLKRVNVSDFGENRDASDVRVREPEAPKKLRDVGFDLGAVVHGFTGSLTLHIARWAVQASRCNIIQQVTLTGTVYLAYVSTAVSTLYSQSLGRQLKASRVWSEKSQEKPPQDWPTDCGSQRVVRGLWWMGTP
jgi:hypothetical protein